MHYGKRLREEVERNLPEWGGQVMSYKMLKKQLKFIDMAENINFGFSSLLDKEIDKVNSFYLDKQEDYVIELKELEIKVGNYESEEEKLQVLRALLDFHAEMVLLLRYSALNSTGLVKIVKKHNKRTGTSFQLSSIPKGMEEPFYSTDLLLDLLTKCEAMLDRLSNNNAP